MCARNETGLLLARRRHEVSSGENEGPDQAGVRGPWRSLSWAAGREGTGNGQLGGQSHGCGSGEEWLSVRDVKEYS